MVFRGEVRPVSVKRIRRRGIKEMLNENLAVLVRVVRGPGFTYYAYTTENGGVGAITEWRSRET